MPRVNISQTIADEYLSRCVWENEGWEGFPEHSGRSMFVTLEAAKAMRDDAAFQADSKCGPEEMLPHIRRAYRALHKQLVAAINSDAS